MIQAPVDGTALAQWTASGLQRLTGLRHRPLGPPEGLVAGVVKIGDRFDGLDALALLGERAAFTGFRRRGTTSCGGACDLLRAADGWLAVSLPRADDVAAVPAWLEMQGGDAAVTDGLVATPELWDTVARHVGRRPSEWLTARAELLQLPVAALGLVSAGAPVNWQRLGDAAPRPDRRGLRVIDLTALWAGPLCGDLLAREGADVVKVESVHRPDGARGGPPGFFDVLNGGKRSVALDFSDPEGLALLHDLVRTADVVLEASRPRALEQLGLRAADVVTAGGPRIWVSITGYGRSGEMSGRVAFGDDAAVAGGLVTWDDDTPVFCADAVADPLAGLAAARACLDALDAGGRWLLDTSMAATAAALAGPALPLPRTDASGEAEPRARRALGPAPSLGAHTAQVVREVRRLAEAGAGGPVGPP